MKKEIMDVRGVAPSAGPFNHVVKAGGFLFLSSQLSIDLETNKILAGGITEQTRNALENLKFLLESSGSNMEDVVRIAIYLRNIEDFDEMNDVYREYFVSGQEPARVTVQARSPIESIDIEIEAIAVA